jgi:hypothetical protein
MGGVSTRLPPALLVLTFAWMSLRLAPVGCRAEQRAAPEPPAATRGEGEQAPAPAGEPLPAPGAWSVTVSGGVARIVANAAPRGEVLRELAERGGFELELGEGAVLPPLSARIEGSLDEALPIVVGPLDYRVERVFEPGLASHQVRRVSVGTVEPDRPDPPAPSGSGSHGWPRIEELRERLEPSARLTMVFEKLESPDPDERAGAVAELEPAEEELEVLRAALEDDPAAAVRIAAAEQLAGAGSYGATQALLAALSDRDPEVVAAVVEGLASSGDASVIPELAALLEHREPGVRDAAARAIEALGD